MKKISSIIILLAFFTTLYAQQEVTKFLGIPVDGTKSAMIQKLKAKGFKYNKTFKCLEGEFNGHDVNIHIVTNNNKVWRIMVADTKTVDESQIKIRFNNLYQQFQNNERYMPASSEDYSLSETEDISYEIMVHKKQYEAVYLQLETKDIETFLVNNYTKEQLQTPPTEEMREELMNYMWEKIKKRKVWFTINEFQGKYYMAIFYDNEYNMANGEDL